MRQLPIGKKSLTLPSMVPSVSSFETQLEPLDALHIQNLLQEPVSLVSAFDLRDRPADLEAICAEFRKHNILLLDSGGYESSRIKRYAAGALPDWNIDSFKSVCKRVPCDLVFSFDYFIGPGEAPADFELRLIDELRDHHKFLKWQQLIPVIHLQSLNGQKRLNEPEILSLMSRIASDLKSLLIAIPERELGAGLIAKTKLTRKIVNEIKKTGNKPALHILGCGNLLSFAFLATAGAELFDGLEWCRTCIASDFHLHHFQHQELFNAPPDDVPNITADYLLTKDFPYQAHLAIRNLKAIQSYSNELQTHLGSNSFPGFVEGYFGKTALEAFEATKL
ncbi:MAG: bifunctional adenosylcobinamide kinase/adenosylcobinamide-phosphate guanylyltransferase [Hyphomicrobiales bacterium]|nr:bifunctional adenosylcobinamide kinase/adenosylcobinamide-phosphate guanylyltransferase [Hyphomicrobiales bacterium]